MKERPCFYQPFLSILSHGYIARFWNSNQTVRFDRENLEPLIFAVLLVSGTAIWEKKKTRANRGWTSRFSWFLFFSKYWLKLKIWPACTLDFFQIWNQKIYERKKENKLRRRRWKVGVVRSWRSKLATQHRSPVTAFIFIFIFCFYFFFLLLFLLLLFLLSVSTAVVSISYLLSICVCVVSFEFFFMFPRPFHMTYIG